MALKHLASILFVSLLLTSCQKTIDWSIAPDLTAGTGGTGGISTGGTTGELLVKVIVESGSESYTTLYTYDASKRLITEFTKGTSGGMELDIYKKLYREPNGRIFKVAHLIKQQSVQMDTSFMQVFYPNATSKNFTYTTNEITVSGIGSHDSTTYTWNANGNITSHTSHLSSNIMPGTIISKSKFDYTYSNGNLTQTKAFGELTQGGPLSLILTTNYIYDNNTNPLITDGEFVLTGKTEGASKNNVTKMELIDATTPSNSRTLTTSITYGAGKKPTAGTVTMLPQNQVFKYTFFYQ